jgi:hypothetical protein
MSTRIGGAGSTVTVWACRRVAVGSGAPRGTRARPSFTHTRTLTGRPPLPQQRLFTSPSAPPSVPPSLPPSPYPAERASASVPARPRKTYRHSARQPLLRGPGPRPLDHCLPVRRRIGPPRPRARARPCPRPSGCSRRDGAARDGDEGLGRGRGEVRGGEGEGCFNVTCVQCENGKSISPIDSAQPTMAHDADTDSDLHLHPTASIHQRCMILLLCYCGVLRAGAPPAIMMLWRTRVLVTQSLSEATVERWMGAARTTRDRGGAGRRRAGAGGPGADPGRRRPSGMLAESTNVCCCFTSASGLDRLFAEQPRPQEDIHPSRRLA